MQNRFIYELRWNNHIIGFAKILGRSYDFNTKDWPFDRKTLDELRTIPRLRMIIYENCSI